MRARECACVRTKRYPFARGSFMTNIRAGRSATMRGPAPRAFIMLPKPKSAPRAPHPAAPGPRPVCLPVSPELGSLSAPVTQARGLITCGLLSASKHTRLCSGGNASSPIRARSIARCAGCTVRSPAHPSLLQRARPPQVARASEHRGFTEHSATTLLNCATKTSSQTRLSIIASCTRSCNCPAIGISVRQLLRYSRRNADANFRVKLPIGRPMTCDQSPEQCLWGAGGPFQGAPRPGVGRFVRRSRPSPALMAKGIPALALLHPT